jgi:fused signal recognition particle receptor
MFRSPKWNSWQQKLKEVLTKDLLDFSSSSNEVFSEAQLEEILFESDLPSSVVQALVKKTKSARKENKEKVFEILVSATIDILRKVPNPPMNLPTPGCILLVGVNGAGKTTTAARLGHYFKKNGREVVLGAADTFRAGATEQLVTWGNRLNLEVVSQGSGSDPASVAFETWKVAKQKNALMIADTAGRIHTQTPLMDQLEKIKRVISKDELGAPHEVWLVLDGTSGQNAVIQAREFAKAVQITGLVITKLDGTAKGGGAVGSMLELNVPIRFVGIGEKEDDLIEFNLEAFVKSFYGI